MSPPFKVNVPGVGVKLFYSLDEADEYIQMMGSPTTTNDGPLGTKSSQELGAAPPLPEPRQPTIGPDPNPPDFSSPEPLGFMDALKGKTARDAKMVESKIGPIVDTAKENPAMLPYELAKLVGTTGLEGFSNLREKGSEGVSLLSNLLQGKTTERVEDNPNSKLSMGPTTTAGNRAVRLALGETGVTSDVQAFRDLPQRLQDALVSTSGRGAGPEAVMASLLNPVDLAMMGAGGPAMKGGGFLSDMLPKALGVGRVAEMGKPGLSLLQGERLLANGGDKTEKIIDATKAFLKDPNKQPVEFISKPTSDKELADWVVQSSVEQAALRDAGDMGKFLNSRDGQTRWQKGLNWFRRELGDVGKKMGRADPNGGEAYQKLIQGNKWKNQRTDELASISEDAENAWKGYNKFKKRDITNQVKEAVESGSTDKLTDPDAVLQYNAYVKRQEMFTNLMQDAGLKTRKNYFQHILETVQGNLDDIFENKLPGEISVGATKARSQINPKTIQNDLWKMVNAHDQKVMNKIVYDPVVKWANELPNGITPELAKYMRKVIFPDSDTSSLFSYLAGVRFKTKLKYNPFSAAENLGQKHLAKGAVEAEASVLGNEIAKNRHTLGLDEYFGGVSSRGMDVEGTSKTLHGGLFSPSENTNWIQARAAGLAQEVVNHPDYQKLLKAGKSRIEAFNELKNEFAFSRAENDFIPVTVLDRGMQRGEDLASGSQFVNQKGLRPEMFDESKDTFKLITQFKRFDASSAETIKDLFTLKGKEGRILRRGFQDETPVVQALDARRTVLKGLEQNYKMKKVTKEVYNTLKPALQDEIKLLEDKVRFIDPSTKGQATKQLGAFLGKSATVRAGRILTKMGVVGALAESGLLPNSSKRGTFGQSARYSAEGMIPGVGTAKWLMSLVGAGQSDENPVLSNLISTIPVLGTVEGTVPGQPVSRVLKDLLKGPKKKRHK